MFICLLDHEDKANINIKRLRWPEKPLLSERAGTKYVAVTKGLFEITTILHDEVHASV